MLSQPRSAFCASRGNGISVHSAVCKHLRGLKRVDNLLVLKKSNIVKGKRYTGCNLKYFIITYDQ